MWTDQKGEKLTTSQFFKRWGEGIAKVSPRQKLRMQMNGTMIILVGLVCGLVVSLIKAKVYWWVAIVLIGAIIINGMQYLGMLQQKKMFDNIEKMVAGNE
jgi:hypothetical protein